jgi:DNA modification methylase
VNNSDYLKFLKNKMKLAVSSGIDVAKIDIQNINTGVKKLKPHEIDAIRWAAIGGRRALFESFGLGKTCQQLALAKLITDREDGKFLIIMPLGVKQEFKRDAQDFFNINDIVYVKTLEECRESSSKILITNYERVRDGNIDPNYFIGCSLDEASILRGYGTKTYQTFLTLFDGVKYKFVATATPSPNRYKELIHYAGFLGIMDTGQALTRFFKRDSTKANKLTLYPHKEEEFWLWVSTWALFITKPSDLGYDDTGYDLPPLNIHTHRLKVDHLTAGADRMGQMQLFRDAALSIQDACKEKRDSLDNRIDEMMRIIDANQEKHFIIWHDLESERHAIKKALPEVKEIYGTLDIDIREQRTIDFSDGKIKYIATKPEISGSGVNWQRYCSNAIFLGIGYKFNDFLQAIHRLRRFLQDKEVNIFIIYTESEDQIYQVLLQKWQQHDYLVNKMIDIIKKYNLSINAIEDGLKRSFHQERTEVKKNRFIAINNDNVIECRNMKDNCIDLLLTSIPFSNHYEYTPTYNDFGHNENNEKFFIQMDFLTPHLLRLLKPGRVACIHVKDRVLFGNATGDGMPTIDPFSDMTVFHFIKHGFRYMGRIVVLTDVVRENNQTYRLGWSEQCKDGTKMGVGCPEYILLFRKLPSNNNKAYADNPVIKSKKEYTRAQWQIDAHAFWKSSGNRLLSFEELKNIKIDNLQHAFRDFTSKEIYDYDQHIELSKYLDENNRLPAAFMVVAPGSWSDLIWDDINRMRTLNGNQSAKNLQMHICPFQLDIVERLINRFSNKNDVVFDPFAGLFTAPYMAVKMGRKGIGIELNLESFYDGVQYMNAVEEEYETPTLFDYLDMAG